MLSGDVMSELEIVGLVFSASAVTCIVAGSLFLIVFLRL